MAKVTMSVHRALAELKLLDARIQNGNSQSFVTANKRSNKDIGGKTVAEHAEVLAGNLKSY
jgi:hypothetical protein